MRFIAFIYAICLSFTLLGMEKTDKIDFLFDSQPKDIQSLIESYLVCNLDFSALRMYMSVKLAKELTITDPNRTTSLMMFDDSNDFLFTDSLMDDGVGWSGILMWNCKTGELEAESPGTKLLRRVKSEYKNEKYKILFNDQGGIELNNPKTNDKYTFVGHASKVQSAALTPNEKFLISVADDGIKVWDVESGNCLITVNKKTKINDLLINPNSKTIAFQNLADKSRINLFNLNDISNSIFEKLLKKKNITKMDEYRMLFLSYLNQAIKNNEILELPIGSRGHALYKCLAFDDKKCSKSNLFFLATKDCVKLVDKSFSEKILSFFYRK